MFSRSWAISRFISSNLRLFSVLISFKRWSKLLTLLCSDLFSDAKVELAFFRSSTWDSNSISRVVLVLLVVPYPDAMVLLPGDPGAEWTSSSPPATLAQLLAPNAMACGTLDRRDMRELVLVSDLVGTEYKDASSSM
jgi:hypothetical protein